MVEIRPFRALRYTVKAGNIKNLITQPYDKITPEMQQKYYKASDYNYCKLVLPSEENRYEISAKRVKEWILTGILKKDSSPAIYVYFQDFEVLGKRCLRKGMIAAVKLSPFEDGVVLPHEKTHKGPKIDRMNMLRATLKNLEPGFMLYPDPGKRTIAIFDEVAKGTPIIDVVDDVGVRNRIWAVTDPSKIRKIQDVLKNEQVVIADGHHRYETAVTFRDELRKERKDWMEDEAFNFRQTLLVATSDDGLVILPGHRLLLKTPLTDKHMAEIKKYFDTNEMKRADIENFLSSNKDRQCFVAYDGNKFTGMVLKNPDGVLKFFKTEYSNDYKKLDVVALRDVIFDGIMGEKDLKIDVDIDYLRWIDDAIGKVNSGKAKVAFLLNATRPEQVLKVSKNRERMPEKSTDFYPKMMSGMTMLDITPGEKL